MEKMFSQQFGVVANTATELEEVMKTRKQKNNRNKPYILMVVTIQDRIEMMVYFD